MRCSLTMSTVSLALAAIIVGAFACSTAGGTKGAGAAAGGPHAGPASGAPHEGRPARSPSARGADAEAALAGGAAGSHTDAAFGVALYLDLASKKPGSNVFISPASVAFALGMTLNGAGGETREAIAKTLGRPAGDQAAANAADSALIAGLNDTLSGIDLSVANALFARKGVRFNGRFLKENSRFYGAELDVLDFEDPGSAAVINGWVAGKTRNRITRIVDQIDPSSIMFLVDAIYFKGSWTHAFDAKETHDAPFHLAGGGEIERPLMRRSGTYDYLEADSLQAVRLPYGDGRFAMYVFLPSPGSSLREFQRGLTAGALERWIGSLAPRRGTVELPRFRLEYEARLRQALGELGMGVAFDCGAADFKNMAFIPGMSLCIHDVLHKTFVEVNELGTEAAAVTSVEMRLTSAMEPVKAFEMIVDRPFFFVIRDGETGLMLFMGSMVNPQ
jgi:serine protease inhibitor